MALVLKDRIKETTATTGTGTYSLAGADAGFQGFSEIGNGNTCYYACTDGTDFEVGVGTFTASGSTLARTTILESSNSDAAVNWGAGTKDIFVTAPAAKLVYEDAAGDISVSGTVDITDTTDSSDATGDTGALRTEGGASIAKKLFTGDGITTSTAAGDNNFPLTAYHPTGTSARTIARFQSNVGSIGATVASITAGGKIIATELDVSGAIDVDAITHLDVVNIDGSVDMAETLTLAGNADFNGTLDVSGTTNLDVVDIDGAVDFASTTAHAGNATFADDVKAIFGTGSDLQIYSDGDASHIDESGTGNFVVKATNIQFTGDNDESLAWFVADGAVTLYYNGVGRASTTSSGFDVNGNITASGTVDGRDLATDGDKLDLIEASADVTDTANVTAAGALMDSELTSEASVKALDQGVGTTDAVTHLSLNVKNGSSQNSITSGGGYLQYNADTSSNQQYRGHIFNIRGEQWLTMADYTTASADKIFSRKKHVFDNGVEVTGDISFEGATANDYETTLTVADPTADRTITLPNQTGTAMLWQSAWPDDPASGGDNIAIGDNALINTTSSAVRNTAVGHEAAKAITSGERNTLIGVKAGNALTTGSYCVAIGEWAMPHNTTDSYTTSVGAQSGLGDFLLGGTYVGAYAGNYNSTHKDYQTAIGYNAMNDCSGDYSTAVGHSAMYAGDHYRSTAVGYYALSRSSTGSPWYNTAVGQQSGNTIWSGDGNTLVGHDTDTYTWSTSYGVAVGYQPRAGTYGVSIGYQAAYSQLADSNYNVCIGKQAGYDLDGGDYCTFIGDQAGYAGGTGSSNTSVGAASLLSLTDGTHNNSLGYHSLYSVTSGDNNSSLGSNSGRSVSTGDNNTLLGYHAGYKQGISTTNALTTGSNVTCVGFEAMPSSGTATNEIVLGDASISSLRCNVQTISSLSDERDKTAIKDLTYGLDFVNDMRPVEFTWNRRDGSLGAKTDMGFIAQDLYETELDHSSSSRTRLVNWDNPEKLEADYVRSYPILVKAVQELSAQVTALQAQIETLEGN